MPPKRKRRTENSKYVPVKVEPDDSDDDYTRPTTSRQTRQSKNIDIKFPAPLEMTHPVPRTRKKIPETVIIPPVVTSKPTFKNQETQTTCEESDAGKFDCPICSANIFESLPCCGEKSKSTMCITCATKWILQNGTCPFCREKLFIDKMDGTIKIYNPDTDLHKRLTLVEDNSIVSVEARDAELWRIANEAVDAADNDDLMLGTQNIRPPINIERNNNPVVVDLLNPTLSAYNNNIFLTKFLLYDSDTPLFYIDGEKAVRFDYDFEGWYNSVESQSSLLIDYYTHFLNGSRAPPWREIESKLEMVNLAVQYAVEYLERAVISRQEIPRLSRDMDRMDILQLHKLYKYRELCILRVILWNYISVIFFKSLLVFTIAADFGLNNPSNIPETQETKLVFETCIRAVKNIIDNIKLCFEDEYRENSRLQPVHVEFVTGLQLFRAEFLEYVNITHVSRYRAYMSGRPLTDTEIDQLLFTEKIIIRRDFEPQAGYIIEPALGLLDKRRPFGSRQKNIRVKPKSRSHSKKAVRVKHKKSKSRHSRTRIFY